MTEIQHHLTEDLIVAYAAGTLGHAFSVVVAAHFSLCDECRSQLEAHEHLGGAVLEDLTQETFLRAWYHIGQLRNGKALNGWLFRIAGNVSKLHHRRHKDRSMVDLDSIEPQAGGVDGPQRAGDREQMGHLHEAVARLPWKLKQAIVLHYMEQLTISEAAEAVGIRPGTLKSRLNRGLEALRGEVADE